MVGTGTGVKGIRYELGLGLEIQLKSLVIVLGL